MKKKSLMDNPVFRAIIEESRLSYKQNGGLTAEQVRKELGLKPAKRRRKTRRKP